MRTFEITVLGRAESSGRSALAIFRMTPAARDPARVCAYRGASYSARLESTGGIRAVLAPESRTRVQDLVCAIMGLRRRLTNRAAFHSFQKLTVDFVEQFSNSRVVGFHLLRDQKFFKAGQVLGRFFGKHPTRLPPSIKISSNFYKISTAPTHPPWFDDIREISLRERGD